MNAPVFVALTSGGLALARRMVVSLGEGEVHGLARRVDGADVGFDATVDHLRALFATGCPIVGVCAAGILIRALATSLGDKWSEPPVIAVAEDGSAVVPLLGGHHGGHELAGRIAEVLGVAPALTTGSDVRLGVALDEPPTGYRLANPQHAGGFAARLLAGEPVRIDGAAPWLSDAKLIQGDAAALTIRITTEHVPGGENLLVYHPSRLAVGVGCERGVDSAEVVALVADTLAGAGLAPGAVALIASLDLKSDEPAIHAAATRLGVPARFFDAETLEAETPRLATPSDLVFREVGCHGVAEAAALAAAGPDSELVVAKRKSARATCAVALAPKLIEPGAAGRARGCVAVVGLGPGQADWRTPEAGRLLAAATDLVGYGFYLDIAGARPGQCVHRFDLGEEEARAAHALRLAAEGRDVALVSSGDPGIYAMATLVCELAERCDEPAWGRVELVVAPGISALQAAAARVGAPLGHDFCAISLSDLLTPSAVIKKRLKAAAAGDFVVAFYNPASKRRQSLLPIARDTFLQSRPGSTPVVIARSLGRADESVEITDLEHFDPAAVDMMTLVLIGASSTRAVPRGDGRVSVYTPRGYGRPVGEIAGDRGSP